MKAPMKAQRKAQIKASVRALLESAIDYAGTFPPAKLDLAGALRSYAEHRAGPHAWMLGRFILPESRIDELQELRPGLLPPGGEPWSLSLVLSPEPHWERIESFARAVEGRVKIVSVEVPPLEVSKVTGVA